MTDIDALRPVPELLLRDLDTRSQIHDLVVAFYREVVFDELLAPVFGEAAEVDWAVHIPRLIDYWCRVLLREPSYSGRIIEAHRHVHDIEAFRPEHFDRWYALWSACIDAGWRGPVAERAKVHAAHMGRTISKHLLGEEWTPVAAPASADRPESSAARV